MDPSIKVTRIGKRWHARMFVDGEVRDEMACETRADIGYICRTMLRWFDKTGGMSKFAHAARMRNHQGPCGQIWWWGNLRAERERRESNRRNRSKHEQADQL